MAALSFFMLFALFDFVHPYSAEDINAFFKNCQPFSCQKLGQIQFPYTISSRPQYCGPFVVKGCDEEHQEIQLVNGTGKLYDVEAIYQGNSVVITDKELQKHLKHKNCKAFNNFSLPSLPYASFQIMSNLTLFKCDHSVNMSSHFDKNYKGCQNFTIYYNPKERRLPRLPPKCSILQLPLNNKNHGDIFRLLAAKFSLEVQIWPPCYFCHLKGGTCMWENTVNFHCIGVDEDRDLNRDNKQAGNKRRLKMVLGIGLAVATNIMIMLLSIIFMRYRRKRNASSKLFSGHTSSDPSSKSDQGGGNIYLGVPIFSYTELEEATNNFSSERELGDGGFGTVYYGKLQDGKEVAVKYLYEHNYKRVKQFINEIEILTRLRHKNLVSLYGCTPHRSRALLLVYEYIPNGTVADHLHGDRAVSSPLTWPIRMRIAIETSSALAYLHASDIIHRDVKTNNILLDNNFCVKVADFGLSRLFPNNATHVSTAPQGTPGYVDPEYHQCYQLTDKSDVYSFGVVLIELISSMQAVDMTRHRHEINLANLAMDKIQKCEFHKLIDPFLGYNTDEEVKRMTTSVAELAFLCLQQDKELRPPMDEVLKELKRIESWKYNLEKLEEKYDDNEAPNGIELPTSPTDCNEVAQLKTIQQLPSPDSSSDLKG